MCSIPMILANTFLNDIFIVFTKHHRSLQRYRNETSRQTNSQEMFSKIYKYGTKVRLSTTEYNSSYQQKYIKNQI